MKYKKYILLRMRVLVSEKKKKRVKKALPRRSKMSVLMRGEGGEGTAVACGQFSGPVAVHDGCTSNVGVQTDLVVTMPSWRTQDRQ